MTSDRAAKNHRSALREIRAAEAARRLGLLDVGPLPAQAQQWIDAGIDSGNVRALAGAVTSGADPTAQVLAELVSLVAREQGISFPTLQDARKVHAETLLALITKPAEFGPQVFGLSNTVTDELTARLQKLFSRFRLRD